MAVQVPSAAQLYLQPYQSSGSVTPSISVQLPEFRSPIIKSKLVGSPTSMRSAVMFSYLSSANRYLEQFMSQTIVFMRVLLIGLMLLIALVPLALSIL